MSPHAAEIEALKARVSELEVELSRRPTEKVVKSYERELTIARPLIAEIEQIRAKAEKSRENSVLWKEAVERCKQRIAYLENAGARQRRAIAEERAWAWAAGVLDGGANECEDRSGSLASVYDGAVHVSYSTYTGRSECERPLSDFEDPAP